MYLRAVITRLTHFTQLSALSQTYSLRSCQVPLSLSQPLSVRAQLDAHARSTYNRVTSVPQNQPVRKLKINFDWLSVSNQIACRTKPRLVELSTASRKLTETNQKK